MLPKLKKNMIAYMVVCVEVFANRFNIISKDAFNYLYKFGGIEFLQNHYEVEHTLGLEDAIDDLVIICKNNGGQLG